MKYTINASTMMKYWLLNNFSGDREVGGYAEFKQVGDDEIRVVDVTPLKQRSSETFFEIESDAHAAHLLKLVEEGKDPAFSNMLFHTHPGDSAEMSGEDVRQLEEMARDNPGKVAHSMILPIDSLEPLMHTAVYVDGQLFRRKGQEVTILDDMQAHSQLSEIGFFEKESEITHYDFTKSSGTSSGGLRSGYTESSKDYEEYWESVSDDNYIGERVQNSKGSWHVVCDQYDWNGDTTLVLDDGSEVDLDEVTLAGAPA